MPKRAPTHPASLAIEALHNIRYRCADAIVMIDNADYRAAMDLLTPVGDLDSDGWLRTAKEHIQTASNARSAQRPTIASPKPPPLPPPDHRLIGDLIKDFTSEVKGGRQRW